MSEQRWEDPGATALIVPALEAQPLLDELRRTQTSSGSEGVPAHVTLLAPFAPAADLPPLLDDLRALVASWRPAPFVLRRARLWPGVAWLEPEPSAPFLAMTNDLVARFGYMPYEGEHETVIPHVTVATVDDDAVLAEIAAFVEPSLPIECAGGTVQLLQRGGDLHWHERESWSL